MACNDVTKNLNQRFFWTKFLQNVNNPILKHLWKFQVDTPINAKAKAV